MIEVADNKPADLVDACYPAKAGSVIGQIERVTDIADPELLDSVPRSYRRGDLREETLINSGVLSLQQHRNIGPRNLPRLVLVVGTR